MSMELKMKRGCAAAMACLFTLTLGVTGCAKGSGGTAGGGGTLDGEKIPPITLTFDDKGGLPQFYTPKDDEEVALICTSEGNILLRFCREGAPKAVENFVTHAKNGYYNGVTFHRTIEGFMIQGGDPKGDGTGGESIWGEGFGLETTEDLFHFRGALCMAHSAMPDSNGSQFYIVQGNMIAEGVPEQMKAGGWPDAAVKKYEETGGYPVPLDQQYTVFGMVLGGMDVVDAIAVKEADAEGVAANPVKMDKVIIMPYQDAKGIIT